jgi:hypothetical protein
MTAVERLDAPMLAVAGVWLVANVPGVFLDPKLLQLASCIALQFIRRRYAMCGAARTTLVVLFVGAIKQCRCCMLDCSQQHLWPALTSHSIQLDFVQESRDCSLLCLRLQGLVGWTAMPVN